MWLFASFMALDKFLNLPASVYLFICKMGIVTIVRKESNSTCHIVHTQ